MPDVINQSSDSKREQGINQSLAIQELHLHGNDLDALRRLAEANPELAHKVVDNNDAQHRRAGRSNIIGMIVAGTLLVAILAAVVISVIFLGVVQCIALVLVLLGCAFTLRVLLTGEWSETSWLGRIIGGAAHKEDSSSED